MRIFVFLLCLLTFAPTLAAKPAPQVPSQLAATHGYAYVNFPKGTTGTLTVKALAGGSAQEFDLRSDAGKNSYGRWLPAGTYRITKWAGFEWGEYPTFEIQAGRVTDLGSLVPINIGGYEIVVLPVRHAETAHDVDATIGEFSDLLVSKDPIRWLPAAPPKPITPTVSPTGLGLIADMLMEHDRSVNKPSIIGQLKAATTNEEFLRIERSVVPPLSVEAAIDPASNLYFGADLGRIRVRHADGQWDSVGIDTLHAIPAVEYVGNTLVAGSDNGIIRASTDGGRSWTVLKSFDADESVVDIDHGDGYWVVTTMRLLSAPNGVVTTNRLSVFVGKRDDFSDLQSSRDFPLDSKYALGWMGPHGQLAKGSYYVNAFLKLHRLDLSSMQWKNISPPADASGDYVSAKSGTISAFLAKGMFSKVYVSQDHGDTWKQVGRPPYHINDIQFEAADDGFASRWNMNAFSGAWEIYTYDTGRNDWNKTSEAPFNCKPLRVSPDVPLLCIANNASIFSQQGLQWNVEFSTL